MKRSQIRAIKAKQLHHLQGYNSSAVKYAVGTKDESIVGTLVDGDFPNEMEMRITDNGERIEVRGHRSIMDRMSEDDFKRKVAMHVERHRMLKK